MLNNVSICGRLGKDPEARQTASGKSVVMFGIAVDRDFKNASGEKETDWISCVAFGTHADFLCKYAKKGATIAVNGRIQTRKWTGNDGVTKSVTEVIASNVYIVSSPRSEGGSPTNTAPTGFEHPRASTIPGFTELDGSEDDFPF